MNCRKVRSLIHSYIDGTLSTDEMRQFIRHVEHCPSCYDELETSFIVDKALQRLDDDGSGSFDMRDLLRQDLRYKKHLIRQRRLLRIVLTVLILAVFVGVIVELLGAFGIIF